MTESREPTVFAIGAEWLPGISKLTEEMGEVQQVIGRLIQARFLRRGLHWDGSNLLEELVKEMADLTAAIDFVMSQHGDLFTRELFYERRDAKRRLFSQWQKEQYRGV